MTDMDDLRAQLLSRRAELEQRLSDLKRDLSAPLDQDFAEQAVELENSQVMDALGHEAETELASINAALNRLDEGGYGICQDCGEDIAPARLAAQPWAACCLRCASLREQQQGSVG